MKDIIEKAMKESGVNGVYVVIRNENRTFSEWNHGIDAIWLLGYLERTRVKLVTAQCNSETKKRETEWE